MVTDADVSDSDDTFSSIATSLLIRAQKNDPLAWEQLVAVYTPKVEDWCRKQGLSDHDAADVSQEVFRAVARNLKSFKRTRPADTFVGWLWRIARNKIVDHWRNCNNQPKGKGEGPEDKFFENLPFDSETESAESETRTTIRALLEFAREQFKDEQWQILIELNAGKTAEEVAEAFGMQRANVYNIKARLMKKLRQHFRIDEGDQEPNSE